MKVAIIGAGFSGLLAAYQLEKKGIHVTVFEKEELLGGHFRTYVNSDFFVELGTVFSIDSHIKSLLIELNVEFTENFSYRNYVGSDYQKIELLPRYQVATLIEEISRLEKILYRYSDYLSSVNYNKIHEDLLVPLTDFLNYYDLHLIRKILAPHLSSFGFGNIHDIQAFYAFSVFDINTIYSFLKGEKMIFITHGINEVIKKLSQNISNIRLGSEVLSIDTASGGYSVKTNFSTEIFDNVLISSKLKDSVLKDTYLDSCMRKITTYPYFTCAIEVESQNIVTSYFIDHLGVTDKIQFFYVYKKNNRCILVTYAYGYIDPSIINTIIENIEKTGIKVKYLLTTKQWHIFPHLTTETLTTDFYTSLNQAQREKGIYFIGSLTSKPAISNLFTSTCQFIDETF